MALKKSQLYSSLWQSADELRGGMDAKTATLHSLVKTPAIRQGMTQQLLIGRARLVQPEVTI